MAQTKINPADQIPSGSLTRAMHNTTVSGSAVITKVIAGVGISITQTGVDAGTGDVTVNLGPLQNLAVASGATSPVPSGGSGSLLFSTTALIPLFWNGGVWQPFSSAALNGLFGNMSSGNVTLDGSTSYPGMTRSGSVYTLTANLNANNLTINSGVSLFVNGFEVCVQGTLDLSNASTGAINANGVTGAAASTSTPGGSTNGIPNTNNIGGSQAGGAGAAASTGNGSLAATTSTPIAAGGQGGTGSSGGSGTSGSPSGTQAAATVNIQTITVAQSGLTYSGTNILGGGGGVGGGSGAGDGLSANGGAGGGGGPSAGVLAIYANVLKRGAASGIIAAIGGQGGVGGNSGTAATYHGAGGGAGGSGGGGGWVYLVYGSLIGSANSNMIDVGGGAGGNGGNGSGNGQGGAGGWSGWPGCAVIINNTASTYTLTRGYSGVTGSFPSSTTGAAGAAIDHLYVGL
jgi:hypothetical protein